MDFYCGLGLHYGAENLGATVIPVSGKYQEINYHDGRF